MSAPRERTENASKENQSAFSFDDDLKMLAEEFDELSFRRCALEHAQQQAQDFDALTGPDEPMPEPDFAALDQLMEKQLHRKQSERRRRRFYKQAVRFSRIAASFLVVALAGFTVLFFSVDAVKINVVNFIVRSYEVATRFHIEDMLGNMPEDFPELNQTTFREPGYIPKGFDQTYYSCSEGHGMIIYEEPDSPYVLYDAEHLHLAGHRGLPDGAGVGERQQGLSVHQVPRRAQGPHLADLARRKLHLPDRRPHLLAGNYQDGRKFNISFSLCLKYIPPQHRFGL